MTAPFRRAVFFIAGFDPNGAQYLYWLFRREFGKDNALYDRKSNVSRLVADADKLPSWRIATADGARPVTVDYTVLSPRQVVVGNYYVRDVFRLIAAYVSALIAFIRTGAIFYLRKTPVPATIVLVYVTLAVPGFFWVGTTLAYWPIGRRGPILSAQRAPLPCRDGGGGDVAGRRLGRIFRAGRKRALRRARNRTGSARRDWA